MGRFGVIPAWKIWRELLRFGQQLRAIPEAVWEPIAQRRHDAAFEEGFAVNEGTIAPGEKIAMVLIWQPSGIADSLLETCKHLVNKGYSPFIISNAKLSCEDRKRLTAHVWLIMERPNFGYDFGGYRDGLRQLDRMRVAPLRLVILNDSIWYPLYRDDETLERMEESGADVTGTVLRVRGEERFLESYFYSLPQSTLQNPAFKAFWQNLRLTSNKYKVICRGERGFRAAMCSAGLHVVGLFGQEVFLTHLAQAEDKDLRDILRHPASLDESHIAEAAQLVAYQGADFADKARGLIARMLEKGQFYSSFPVGAARFMQYPVLKRSNDRTAIFWRKAFVEAVKMDEIKRPQELFYGEIQICVMKDKR